MAHRYGFVEIVTLPQQKPQKKTGDGTFFGTGMANIYKPKLFILQW